MINKTLFYLLIRSIDIIGVAILPGWCNICRMPTIFVSKEKNLRESLICRHCRSFNRKRQLYHIFEKTASLSGKSFKDITVWNAENSGTMHAYMKKRLGGRYISSEFHGDTYSPGEIVNGIRHEDMRNTSFANDAFDIVLSSDDLEHFPNPEKALEEIARILKPGGAFIFTVPFIKNMPKSEVRAKMNEDGSIEHIKEQQYHGDPVRPGEGILVFTIFGEDMKDMFERVGLTFKKIEYASVLRGIINPEPLIFIAEKQKHTT